MNLTGTERAYRPPGFLFQKHNKKMLQGAVANEAEMSADDLNREIKRKQERD